MTEPITTTNEENTAHGSIEHLDPEALIGDNVRDEVQLDKEFLASLREHGVIVPIIAVRDAEGRTLVREGQRRTFPGKSPCCLGRCWPRAEVGAVTTSPGLGQSWRHILTAYLLTSVPGAERLGLLDL